MTAPAAGAVPVVAPSREDPVVRTLSEVVGGPAGRRLAVPGRGARARILVVLLVLTALSGAMGLLAKEHCRGSSWSAPNPDQYVHMCYSDIPLLYGPRGIAAGEVPYLSDVGPESQVEYPVLTGAVMWLTGLFIPDTDDAGARRAYFDVNVLLLVAALAVAVVATARTAPHRPWDAAMVVLAPGVILAGTINWDLVAVALTSLAMLAWARSRPVAAGIWLGLATAAKFYPLLLLGPLLLLCLRAGRLRAGLTTAGLAIAAWLAVNLPIMVLAWDGWLRFYELSRERGAGYGSVWLSLDLAGVGVPAGRLNSVAGGLFLLCCLGIAGLALFAPRRPRVAQLAFLVVAAFLLTNKVYSPQYVLWLVPLAALALPRWRDFLIWQVAEVVHFCGTWLYLAGVTAGRYDRALSADGYNVAVAAHVLGTLWVVAVVVRDVCWPRYDVVRRDGSDDPHGGVLDGAPDAQPWRARREQEAPESTESSQSSESGLVTDVRELRA